MSSYCSKYHLGYVQIRTNRRAYVRHTTGFARWKILFSRNDTIITVQWPNVDYQYDNDSDDLLCRIYFCSSISTRLYTRVHNAFCCRRAHWSSNTVCMVFKYTALVSSNRSDYHLDCVQGEKRKSKADGATIYVRQWLISARLYRIDLVSAPYARGWARLADKCSGNTLICPVRTGMNSPRRNHQNVFQSGTNNDQKVLSAKTYPSKMIHTGFTVEIQGDGSW